MKSYEVSARTIEEAISNGLEHLGVSLSEVTVDILEEGSKGLFGLFGSRPAKVRLTVKEEEAEESMAHALFEGTLDEEKPAPKKEKSYFIDEDLPTTYPGGGQPEPKAKLGSFEEYLAEHEND